MRPRMNGCSMSDARAASSPIVVALAADAMFVKQLAVVLAGLGAHAQGATKVIVLHDGYDAALRAKVATVAPDVELEWVDARTDTLASTPLPHYLSTATLYRLRVPDL